MNKQVKKVSTYKEHVLAVNKELKVQSKSLGGCRSILLTFASEIGLTPAHKKILQASKKQNNYEILKKYVRTSKNGNYSPFYLLQALNKNSDVIQKSFSA